MKKLIIYTLLFSGLMVYSCREIVSETDLELDPIFNPFDTVDYSVTSSNDVMVDSSSFLGLHYYIFSKRCSQPACHDGTFEPDFRTVQSAYNSLVYHPVLKNTANNDFPYRVTPGDPTLSMMYKRISEHEPPNFEVMPSSGVPLPERQIELIKNWIIDGAKDIYGENASQTSPQPNCLGVIAQLPDANNYRIDTIRTNGRFSPFYAPANQNLNLWFLYLDVNEAGNEVLGNVLTYNKIKFSSNRYDFSNAIELSLGMGFQTFDSVFGSPVGYAFPHYQNITVKLSDYGFSAGDTVYIRTYVQDSDHTSPTEIPKSSTPNYLVDYFTMQLQ